eukprot:scaffold14195_cov65-Cyclotella_meneghiniana.AAC.4
MMGWQRPKITATCCELCTPHIIANINTGRPTAGASSAACQYHLRSTMQAAICSEGSIVAAASVSPTDSLHFCCILHEWESEREIGAAAMIGPP